MVFYFKSVEMSVEKDQRSEIKPGVAAITDSHSQISRYGWMQPGRCNRSTSAVSHLGGNLLPATVSVLAVAFA